MQARITSIKDRTVDVYVVYWFICMYNNKTNGIYILTNPTIPNTLVLLTINLVYVCKMVYINRI